MRIKILLYLTTTLIILQTSQKISRTSKCRGLNIGKKKSGHSVIYNGNISPLFTPTSPLYHHQTFQISKQDTDYFYISGTKNYKPKISKIVLNQNEESYVMTAYRLDEENLEDVLSILYLCNPILPVSIKYELVLSIEDCGDVRIGWSKSCGDLNLPLLGLSVEIEGFKNDYVLNNKENGEEETFRENELKKELKDKNINDVKIVKDGQQILFQKNMIMGEIPISYDSDELNLKFYLEEDYNLFFKTDKNIEKFLKKVAEKSGLFKKHLEMLRPKLTYNEEEIEIKLNDDIINEKFVINSKGFVSLNFEIKCKLDFNDTLIEIDFLFVHGQRFTLHFSKDCENINKKKEIEIIPYLQDDIFNPILAQIEMKGMKNENFFFFWKFFKLFCVFCIVIFVAVFWRFFYDRVRGGGLGGVEKVDRFEDDELKTIDHNLSYGTI